MTSKRLVIRWIRTKQADRPLRLYIRHTKTLLRQQFKVGSVVYPRPHTAPLQALVEPTANVPYSCRRGLGGFVPPKNAGATHSGHPVIHLGRTKGHNRIGHIPRIDQGDIHRHQLARCNGWITQFLLVVNPIQGVEYRYLYLLCPLLFVRHIAIGRVDALCPIVQYVPHHPLLPAHRRPMQKLRATVDKPRNLRHTRRDTPTGMTVDLVADMVKLDTGYVRLFDHWVVLVLRHERIVPNIHHVIVGSL